MSQPIRGQGSHFDFFPIGPKNTNLVEGFEILLPIKFRWIRFSGFRGEVENVSANQRPGQPSCFSDRPEKHKLGRGLWDLASQSSFVEFHSAVAEKKSKLSRPIRGQGGHLVFPIRPKNTNLGRGLLDLTSYQVSLNSVQRFQRRSRKCLSQSEARAAILFFPIDPKNTNLVEGFEILLPIKFRWIFVQRFQRRSRKCLSQSEARAAILFFRSARKTQTW